MTDATRNAGFDAYQDLTSEPGFVPLSGLRVVMGHNLIHGGRTVRTQIDGELSDVDTLAMVGSLFLAAMNMVMPRGVLVMGDDCDCEDCAEDGG